MKQQLIDILETFCPNNVYLQGVLNPNADYPQAFITFFVTETADLEHFDNETAGVAWYFNVVFYSNNPAEFNTIPALIITALKQAGFIPQGKGRDILSDRPTHTGWAMEFIKRENENF